MALQWVLAAVVLGVEALLLALLSAPLYKPLHTAALRATALLVSPLLAVVPFSAFLALEVYWTISHRPERCEGPLCGAAERDRYDKVTLAAHRNALLAAVPPFLYWLLYRTLRQSLHEAALERQLKKLQVQ